MPPCGGGSTTFHGVLNVQRSRRKKNFATFPFPNAGKRKLASRVQSSRRMLSTCSLRKFVLFFARRQQSISMKSCKKYHLICNSGEESLLARQETILNTSELFRTCLFIHSSCLEWMCFNGSATITNVLWKFKNFKIFTATVSLIFPNQQR